MLSNVCSGIRSVAVDPSNEWFVTGSGDRTIKFWDLASGQLKLTLTGHIEQVTGLAISPRHPYMFSCALDKMVKCWDLEYNKVSSSGVHFPSQSMADPPSQVRLLCKGYICDLSSILNFNISYESCRLREPHTAVEKFIAIKFAPMTGSHDPQLKLIIQALLLATHAFCFTHNATMEHS